MQKRIDTRYRWLPFDDKSEVETAMILAARSPLDDARVLWENHREIFFEIEQENPLFPEMTYEKQKGIIEKKVADFKTRIVLIDEPADDEPPMFPGNDEEDTDNEPQTEATT